MTFSLVRIRRPLSIRCALSPTGKPKQTVAATTPAATSTSSSPSGSTTKSTSAPVSYTTASTPIVAPSEVLPNTAISDRPKVKSVSKKDSKNIRKVTAAAAAAATASSLQNSQMAKATSSPISSSEQSLLQQSFSNFSISPSPNQQALQPQQTVLQAPVSVSQQTEQPQPSQNLVVNPIFNRHISKQLNLQQALGGVVNAAAATAAADAVTRATNELLQFGAGLECNEPIAPNETILQLVAQIPNHPLQKIAQRLLADQSKLGGDGKSQLLLHTPIEYSQGLLISFGT